jgi:hypothetical protein
LIANYGLYNLLSLLAKAVSGVYSWKKGDKQTGVAIGAWLGAVQAIDLTVISYRCLKSYNKSMIKGTDLKKLL